MCILFIYTAKNGSTAIRLPYKLILAANRDEFYARPSKEAGFWESPDLDIVAGRDLQSGGTWLGINRFTGKLGVLLNIMGGTKPELSSSRGSLITNFLRSPKHLTGWTYCKNLIQDRSLDIFNSFSQFNLVAIDLLDDDSNIGENQQETSRSDSTMCPKITYFTNEASSMKPAEPDRITTDYFAIGTTPYSKPFKKTTVGAEMFEAIVDSTEVASKDELKSKLLQLLKSTQKHYPDPVLQKQGHEKSEHLLNGLSSVFVEPAHFNNLYGTRTHTITLVDNDNNVDFHEWTIQLNENADAETPYWVENNYNFRLPSIPNRDETALDSRKMTK